MRSRFVFGLQSDSFKAGQLGFVLGLMTKTTPLIYS